MRSVTGREQELAALRAVFHDLPEARCLLCSLRDGSGQVVDFEVMDLNPAGERALRRTRESVVGQRLAAVFHDERALEVARQVVVAGESVEEEVEGCMRRIAPAGDGVAVTLRPPGDGHQAQATEAFERLIGGLAHDFNNLLTPILAYTNIGLSQIAPGEPMYEELLEIRRAAERASALIQQVQTTPAPKCSPPADG
jgi:signal transduction histidine kinase